MDEVADPVLIPIVQGPADIASRIGVAAGRKLDTRLAARRLPNNISHGPSPPASVGWSRAAQRGHEPQAVPARSTGIECVQSTTRMTWPASNRAETGSPVRRLNSSALWRVITEVSVFPPPMSISI